MPAIKDFSGVCQEGRWLLKCAVVGVVFCSVAPEYGYDHVPFITGCLYVLAGVFRLLHRRLRRPKTSVTANLLDRARAAQWTCLIVK